MEQQEEDLMEAFYKDVEYGIRGDHMRKLEGVMKALFSPKPLSGDERRDLANMMFVILHEAVKLGNEREES